MIRTEKEEEELLKLYIEKFGEGPPWMATASREDWFDAIAEALETGAFVKPWKEDPSILY